MRRFIYCQSLDLFNRKLQDGEIDNTNIVFIEDIKGIWTNGVIFGSGYANQISLGTWD